MRPADPRFQHPGGTLEMFFMHRLISKRDFERAQKLEEAMLRSGRKLEEAYESETEQRFIDAMETEHEKRALELEGFLAALVETEAEEPEYQQVPLDVIFAQLYDEYRKGFPSRSWDEGTAEDFLAYLLRSVAQEYRGFDDKNVSDRMLIDAAVDAHGRRTELRKRRR